MTASINRKSDCVTFICYRTCSEKSGNLFTEQYLFSEILFHLDLPQMIIYIFFERVKYSSKGRKKALQFQYIRHFYMIYKGRTQSTEYISYANAVPRSMRHQ